MKKLSALFALALVGSVSRAALAAPGDTLAAGDPETLFNVTDYVSTGTSLITSIRFLPDGRMLIGEKTGALKLREADGTIKTLYTFAVTTNSEQGLIGLAVQPDFATSKRIVVYWTRADSVGGSAANRINVSSFQLNADDTVDFASERILVKDITAPANHDGGALSFGPDGLLYVGVGDNGCNESVPGTGLHQNLRGTAMNVATGKVLRVAVDGSIPATNPFVSTTGNITGKSLPSGSCVRESSATLPMTSEPIRKDIYSVGFRNPFRIWADPKTGFIWVGDVGEVTYEEIDVIKAPGKHFGWPFIEGKVGSAGSGPNPATKCSEVVPATGDCLDPAHVYGHLPANANGSVTGGVIVDSCELPKAYRNTYFYADFVARELYSITANAARDGVVEASKKTFMSFAGNANVGPTEIVSGPDGGIYVSILGAGANSRVLRIFPKTVVPDPECNAKADAGADGGPGPGPGPQPGTDGGPTPGADGGSLGDGGAAAGESEDSGCGCETVGSRGSSAALSLFALSGLALAVARRRRNPR